MPPEVAAAVGEAAAEVVNSRLRNCYFRMPPKSESKEAKSSFGKR